MEIFSVLNSDKFDILNENFTINFDYDELSGFVDTGLTIEGYKSFLIPKDTTELDKKITKNIRAAIGAIAKPHKIIYLEELPKTTTGKIERYKLREEAKNRESSSEKNIVEK